jgi:hypothetical protein
MLEEMSFDLERKIVKVNLRDPKSGETKTYALQEMDGTLRDEYLNAVKSKLVQSADGKTSRVTDFKGLQGSLLAKSLFLSTFDGDKLVSISSEPVSLDFIQALPASCQAALLKKAKDLSGLGEDAEDKAKND